MANHLANATIPADIVTYRHGSKLVYVRPADDYEQAIDFAQKEFPEELSHVSRDRISFNIVANMGGQRCAVRISESAWVATVARLLRGEVIDVQVRPQSDVKDQPPQYLEVPRVASIPIPSRPSRSTPTSPTHSRHSSPSDRSSRHWFGKF